VARIREWGELESQIMNFLWDAPAPLGARDIQRLFVDHTPAYSTVMTTLTRLEKKGHVKRGGPSPRKTKFEAVRTNEEQTVDDMVSVLDQANDREAALLAFAGNLDSRDLELLRSAFTK